MNPAYALRQFMNEFESSYGETGKITSLNLLNPNNAPDEFETKALKIFELNTKPIDYFKKMKDSNGQMELRYVKSLIIKDTCLKCHRASGYKVGDVRGGLSIRLPLKKYEEKLSKSLEYLQFIHLIALSIGLLFLYLTYRYLKKQQLKEIRLNEHINEIYSIFNKGDIVLLRWENNEKWNIDYVSNNVEKLLGYKKYELINGKISYISLIDKRDIDMVKYKVKEASKLKNNDFLDKPYRIKTKAGRTLWVKDSLQIIRDENQEILFYVGYIRDVTKQQNEEAVLKHKIDKALKENTKQLQALQQQSKMASMGEMIGAIAHQWRQPLNELGLSIQNLKYDYKENMIDEEFIKKFIIDNKKTIMFMSNTIDDFRSFFRVDKKKIDFKVKETTISVISMQKAQLNSHNIDVEIRGNEFIYNGFQSEYQQVILNIINNAKDAFIENKIKNSKIEITIENNKIIIQDNAGGIKEDVIKRIFEPYFTTKEQGKGTGMGLYMSKMIIEDNMSGKLSVKNNEDGACFILKLS